MKKLMTAVAAAAVLLSVSSSAQSIDLGKFFALFSAAGTTCTGGATKNRCEVPELDQ